MLWNKEVEVAKSVDDLVTSQSIDGHEFLDFEMLDAKIASALKGIIRNQYFRGRMWKSSMLKNTMDFLEEDRWFFFFDLRPFSSNRR